MLTGPLVLTVQLFATTTETANGMFAVALAAIAAEEASKVDTAAAAAKAYLDMVKAP
jgi:hypothetical protein